MAATVGTVAMVVLSMAQVTPTGATAVMVGRAVGQAVVAVVVARRATPPFEDAVAIALLDDQP